MTKCSCRFLMCPAAAVEVGGIWRKEENLAAVLFKDPTIFPAESLTTPRNQSPDHWVHVSMLQLPKFPSQLILCALFSISKTVPKSWTVLPLRTPLFSSAAGNYTWIPKHVPLLLMRKSDENVWCDSQARIPDRFSHEYAYCRFTDLSVGRRINSAILLSSMYISPYRDVSPQVYFN